MTKKEYNGWFNYETWLCALWLDNERGSSDFWREQAETVWSESKPDGMFTRDEVSIFTLANMLNDSFKEAQPEVTGFWADLINASLSEVNWHEIAEHYINDIDKDGK